MFNQESFGGLLHQETITLFILKLYWSMFCFLLQINASSSSSHNCFQLAQCYFTPVLDAGSATQKTTERFGCQGYWNNFQCVRVRAWKRKVIKEVINLGRCNGVHPVICDPWRFMAPYITIRSTLKSTGLILIIPTWSCIPLTRWNGHGLFVW